MKFAALGKRIAAIFAVFALLFGLAGCLEEQPNDKVTIEEAQANVESALANIVFDDTMRNSVAKSFALASKNARFPNVVLEWTSSEEDIIAIAETKEGGLQAKVTRPATSDPRAVNGEYVEVTLTVIASEEAEGQVASAKKEITFRVLASDVFEQTIAGIKTEVYQSLKDRGVALNVNDSANAKTYVVYARVLAHNPGQSMYISDGTGAMVVYGKDLYSSGKYAEGALVKVTGDVYSYFGNVEFGANVEIEVLEETDEHANIQVNEYVDAEIEEYTSALTASVDDKKFILDVAGLQNFSGGAFRLYAKVVKVEAAPGDQYALEDPNTGTQISLYHYCTDGAESKALIEQFVGKYVYIEALTIDRYSTNDCYRVVWNGKAPEEAEAPTLTDADKVDIALKNLAVDAEVDADIELPALEGLVWTLKAASENAAVEGNKLTVVRAEVDVEVVLVATLTIGSASASKEFTVKILASVIPYISVSDAAAAVLDAAQDGATVYIKGYIAEGSKLDKYGNFVLQDFAGNTVTIYGGFGKDAAGNYLFPTIQSELGLAVGVCVGVKGTVSTNYKNVTGLEIVEVFADEAVKTPAEGAAAVQDAAQDGKTIVIAGIVAEGSKLDKYGNFVLTDGTATVTIYGGFGKDAEGNYLFPLIQEELKIGVGSYVVVKGTIKNQYGNVTGTEILYVFNDERSDEEIANEALESVKVNTTLTEDLELPALEGLVWSLKEASEYAAIEEGLLKVTRPAAGSEDAQVVLVATLTYGEATVSKEYTLTVKAEIGSEEVIATPEELSFVGLANKASADTYMKNNFPDWTITGKLGNGYADYLGFGRSGDATSAITSPEFYTTVEFTVVAVIKGNGSNKVMTSTLTFELVDANGAVVATSAAITPVDAVDTTYEITFTFVEGKTIKDATNLRISFAKATGNIGLKSVSYK